MTLQVFAPFEQERLLSRLALIEGRSEHPLAVAIVHAAETQSLSTSAKVAQFKAIPGAGVEARLDDGESYLIGSEKLMREHQIDVANAARWVESATTLGQGYFFAAVNGQLAGLMVIADPIKPESTAAIAELKMKGFEVALISGDNVRTATAVAAQLGFEENAVFSEIRPNEKAQVVQSMQQAHKRVAFVGDGLNDAPALTVADVGIAMGTGTDLAIESADVIIMSGDMRNIPRAIRWRVR